MRKIRKSAAAIALSLAMGLTTIGIPGEPVMEVHAEVTPDSSISLADTSEVTAETSGSVLRIYGDGSTAYDVPINVTVNCTVLLDNISTMADLTVADGVTATIVIRGNCSVRNIVASGGVSTQLTISGEDENSKLTTGNIAQAKPGQALGSGYPGDPEMSAFVDIEDCTVTCDNIGCGSNGLGWSYDRLGNGTETDYASDAGSASAIVTIRRATVHANGSIACGGDGILNIGDNNCAASDGGRAGDVVIVKSQVTVGGSMSIGGKGGNGIVRGTHNTVTGGDAAFPGTVTIMNGSVVEVAGNVATAPDLTDESYRSSAEGIYGGTVIVDKSTLTCRDIASGGCGIGKTCYSVSASNTTYYGTAGGGGGVLMAKDAVINCETACNGGEAGEYCVQTVGQETSYAEHPRDGHGGRIEATNSQITITDSACKRAMKWDGYGGSRSYHNRPSFVGGLLMGGKVYGADIITDVTAIDDCELIADYGVVNSEGSAASKCIIHTSDEMAGETVFVTANTVSGSAILNESGQMVTYLATGTNEVKIAGTKTYVGSCLVDANPVFNTFSLEEESIPETPDDGGEDTPGTGGEETPGTGGEETPPATEQEIVIPTAVTGSAVTVLVGEQTLNLESDENGNIQFTIAPDVTEFFVITEPFKYRYPVTDGVVGEPSIIGPTAVLSGNGALKEGDPLHLTVEAAASLETNTLSYEWYKDGTALAVSGSALDISVTALSDAGSYYVVVTESNGQSVTTAAIMVSVDDGSGTGESGGETGDSSGETAGGGSGNTSEENTGGTGEGNSGEGSGSTSGDSSGENFGGSTGSETGGNTGEPSGGNADDSSGSSSGGSAGGSSGGSSSGGSGGSSGGFGGGSTGGTSGGSAGGASSGSSGGASGGTVVEKPSEKPEVTAGIVTDIQMQSNLNGIKLLSTSEKNTYKKYYSKTVKLTVSKEPGYTYYYKIVEKGKANSTVKWKKLTGNVIKVAASDIAKRIYIRAVNENGTSVTRKTTGFYVDNRKPVVKGVTNKAVYTKPVKIRFSDNISVKAATLNGKKVKNGCTVSKKGIYRLIVTDRAGNKKIIRFTIKE